MNEIGYSNSFVCDIINDPPLEIITKTSDFDYIFLGEILEHVENPVLFLKSIIDKYSEHVKKIVISVPNAFTLSNFKNALSNKEIINSDHKYWFTPFTIAKVLSCAGYDNIEISCLKLRAYKNNSFFRKFIRTTINFLFYNRTSMFRDTLLVIADFKKVP